MNNDGKPNLNNSNVENDNDARVAEGYMGKQDLMHAFEPAAGHTASFAQACLDLENVCFVSKLEFKNCPQMQRCHFSKGISFK